HYHHMKNEIAILDFGSQYTHLIARRVRELGVVSHIYKNDVDAKELKNAYGIILSGGPRSLVREPKLKIDEQIFNLGLPILGLCYGHQMIADFFGGKVDSGTAREYGLAKLKTDERSPIFKNINTSTNVWMSHGDHVSVIPPDFKQIATTGNNSIAAMGHSAKKIYGFQFHPEVHHTVQGRQMLYNFIFNICEAEQNWTTDKLFSNLKKQIKKEAGDKNVFLLISGGVDSTVCFALLEKTLGKNRVYGLHVDQGLMRQNESNEVNKALKNIGLNDLHIYQAEAEYLKALKGKADPEAKRKIIGNLFLDIADKVMKKKHLSGKNWLLGQGTIYPDTIESGGTTNADLIKTHHNRVPKILQMIAEGKIIEPIRELYKDGVRAIGEKLGLPHDLLYRHPFPGPGLGIRCLCSKGSTEKPDKLKSPDKKYSVIKLPIKSVGVQGDERSYSHPALLGDINPENINWHFLRDLAPQITNLHKDINRVIFLLAGDKEKIKPSRLHKAYINKKRLDLLRQIDNIVNKHIFNNPICNHIWQMPVILVPFGYDKKESIVLRPVESEEAMTVSFAELPKTILKNIIDEIKKLNKVDYIFYDITNKPPGTIEWE
ncbi:MAG: glutamine-hydrolyzing GMP synthase, partial [Candidatus Magasanikiibacteriota bacterium]